MDIDEIVKGSKAFIQSDSLFRAIIKEVPVATCLFVGREMRVEVANDIMLGYWCKNKSILGLPLAKGLPELVEKPFLDILDKVQFADNGIGFDQQYADKIFNIFQRLHGKSDFIGIGIGLATCRRIVQNHGEEIHASGKSGNGAVFTILLPISDPK